MKKLTCVSILSTILPVFLLISCNKFLEEKPDTKLALPDNLQNLQALLDQASEINNKGTSFEVASADDYWITVSTYNAASQNSRNAYTWNNVDDPGYPNDWARIYDVANVANTILENIEKITPTALTQSAWNNIKGSALFMRAWVYLNAVWIWGKAYDKSYANTSYGIVLRLTSDFNAPSKRATLEETYNRIIQDAKQSVAFIPDIANHPLRPSKAAVYGLLSRAYLSMSNYDSAYKYADLSLKLYNQLLDYNQLDSNANAPFAMFNKEVVFSNVTAAYSYLIVAPFNTRIDTVLYASYEPDDLRRVLFFTIKDILTGYYGFKGLYSGDITLFKGVATDELYLTRAECNARLENTEAALKDLNDLMVTRWRKNKFIPFAATTPTTALEIILRERRKELLFRGLRWMDIKRLNLEGRNIVLTRIVNGQTYTLNPNDSKYALPIPPQIIEMTGMPQN